MTADAREEFLEVLGTRGERSRTSCGCLWVRTPPGGVAFRGVTISGDVLASRCEWHEWYSGLSLDQQREVERQRRERLGGKACGA